MPISLRWRVADVCAILPAHFLGRPNLEVLALLLLQDVAITVARVLGPASEHDDVGARDIEGVAIPCFWGEAGNSKS